MTHFPHSPRFHDFSFDGETVMLDGQPVKAATGFHLSCDVDSASHLTLKLFVNIKQVGPLQVATEEPDTQDDGKGSGDT